MADKSFFGGFMADNLQQVLALLQQSGKALSSSAIRTQLPIAERTLSRLLKQLTEAGQIQAIGHRRGRVYQSITPVTLAPSALPNIIPSLFSKLAFEAIEQVRKPLIYRQPCTYNKIWLDAYQPNHTFYLSEPDRQLLWLSRASGL